MKLKIPKNLNINKQLKGIIPWVEYWARFLVLMFGIVLAIITVTSVLSILPEDTGLQLAIFLILFIIAATIVFIFEGSRLFRRYASKQRESTETPVHIERPGRNSLISIGLLALLAVILALFFIARQLPTTPQGYQTFFTAFAAVGAWGTGIALAVFAYQQYKLRQTEHNLLFNPQLLLTSGNISIDGLINKKEPYRIKWIVFLQNSSQIPILILHMQVNVRLLGEDSKGQPLTPLYCHVSEPANLSMPFEVNLAKPQRLVWIVEGSSAGDVFDYVRGDSGKRDFELVFQVFAGTPLDPQKPVFYKETISWGIHVRANANWVSRAPFLDNSERG